MPVIDRVANDYLDDVTFLAVAGRGDLDATAAEAQRLFSDNLLWGLDDGIWDLYGIPGQPASVIVVDGVIVDLWFGALGEQDFRDRLDNAISLGA